MLTFARDYKRDNEMRIILFILSLLFCLTIDAQELTVKSFTEKPTDLSARTEERVDYNKVPCAFVYTFIYIMQ